MALTVRDRTIQLTTVRSIEELRELTRRSGGLDLVVVDTIQAINLEAICDFHREHPHLPCWPLACTAFVRREDGVERLCEAVEAALSERLDCSPEIAAAMLRGLFQRGPIPVQTGGVPLTRR